VKVQVVGYVQRPSVGRLEIRRDWGEISKEQPKLIWNFRS